MYITYDILYYIYEIKFIIKISKLNHFIEQMSTKNSEENQYIKEDSILPSYVLSSYPII